MSWVRKKLSWFRERKGATHELRSIEDLQARLSTFHEEEDALTALRNCRFLFQPTYLQIEQCVRDTFRVPWIHFRALEELLKANTTPPSPKEMYDMLNGPILALSIRGADPDYTKHFLFLKMCEKLEAAEQTPMYGLYNESKDEPTITDFLRQFAAERYRIAVLRRLGGKVRWGAAGPVAIAQLFTDEKVKREAMEKCMQHACITVLDIRDVLDMVIADHDKLDMLRLWCRYNINRITLTQGKTLVKTLPSSTHYLAMDALTFAVQDTTGAVTRIKKCLAGDLSLDAAFWLEGQGAVVADMPPAVPPVAAHAAQTSAPRKPPQHYTGATAEKLMRPNEQKLANGVFVPRALPGQRESKDEDACIACCEFKKNTMFEHDGYVMCSGYCAPCALRILKTSNKCPGGCGRVVIRMITYF